MRVSCGSGALFHRTYFDRAGVPIGQVMSVTGHNHVSSVQPYMKHTYDSANNALGVYLDNQEVSSEIRTEKTAELASKFAMIGQLRESLLLRQQDFRQLPGLVADGRDMGTVVFKDAMESLLKKKSKNANTNI